METKNQINPRMNSISSEKLSIKKIMEVQTKIRRSKFRNRNMLVGMGFGAFVVGVYVYSILSTKQETFLDEDFQK